MTKFILHGGFTKAQNELNESFYTEMSKGVPNGGTILLVYFAGKDEDIDENARQDKEAILKRADQRRFNFVLATKKDFIDQIKSADAIYLRGGDTDKLLTTLNGYPDFKDAIKGKIVSGSSAGAYVLSTFYFTHSKDAILKGLGILPVRVICHYKSAAPGFAIKSDPAERMKEYPTNLQLIVLKDYEWRVIET